MLLESPHIFCIYKIHNGLINSSPCIILTLKPVFVVQGVHAFSCCFYSGQLFLLPDRSGVIDFLFNTVMEHRKH